VIIFISENEVFIVYSLIKDQFAVIAAVEAPEIWSEHPPITDMGSGLHPEIRHVGIIGIVVFRVPRREWLDTSS
jgi:hypothetical protein